MSAGCRRTVTGSSRPVSCGSPEATAIRGGGECCMFFPEATRSATSILEGLAEIATGQCALQNEAICHRLKEHCWWYGTDSGIASTAIDIVPWDLKGKILGSASARPSRRTRAREAAGDRKPPRDEVVHRGNGGGNRCAHDDRSAWRLVVRPHRVAGSRAARAGTVPAARPARLDAPLHGIDAFAGQPSATGPAHGPLVCRFARIGRARLPNRRLPFGPRLPSDGRARRGASARVYFSNRFGKQFRTDACRNQPQLVLYFSLVCS